MKNWTLILFGASGDLSKRKLIPALYDLCCDAKDKNDIPLIIGVGADATDSKTILKNAKPFITDYDSKKIKILQKKFCYIKTDFTKKENYGELEKLLIKKEKSFGLSGKNRLAYLAASTEFFCEITQKMVYYKIIIPGNNYHRVIYEKPFGWDFESAKKINFCIKGMIDERQIYRIDHYLAKEFVNKILLMRFANTIFKNVWDKDSVDYCKILFYEKINLEGRGKFYDKFGAIKDVLQNHMLQLLALVAMEQPQSLGVEDVRDKKAVILKKIKPISGCLGQYRGYLKEPGVKKNSRTETFASVKFKINHPKWKGVDFYLETGKALAYKSTEIQIVFKPIDKCIWADGKRCEQNVLIIKIAPDGGFSLKINTKKPGTLKDIVSLDFDVIDLSAFKQETAQAYEIIFKEIMRGEQSIVVRFDEIEAQWKITDKIKAMNLPLYKYKKGSMGPRCVF